MASGMRRGTFRVLRLGGILSLGFLFSACATLSSSNQQQGRQAVIDRIVAATVKVTLERDGRRLAAASGVVVVSRQGPGHDPETYVLTAQHTLDGKPDAAIFVRFADPHGAKGKFPAILVKSGQADTLDLALLKVAGVRMAPADFAHDGGARLGEAILVVGFPWGRRLALFSGIVSQVPPEAVGETVADEGAGEQTLVVDAAAMNGVSGGGVFREATGALVGIVEGFQTASIPVEGRTQASAVRVPVSGGTLAVPIPRIEQFLRLAGLELEEIQTPSDP